MAIIKEIITSSGVTTNYHIVNNVTIDREFNRIDVKISSYIDIEARRSKKSPVVTQYQEIPFEVFTNATVNNKDILISCYDYLHTLPKFKGGEKDLNHIHYEMANVKILSSASPTLVAKGNTKYRFTPQVAEIAVTGDNVNLNYKLRYIRQDNKKTNPITEDVVFKQFSLKGGNALTLAPVEFTTGNYTGDNFIHTFYFIAESSNRGTLASNVAFNVVEVKE